ncbi:MAG: FAD-dependent oxidoreductase, partial [Lachnospiraceae bacterium]|nr:FAD-dependent oxidoreductase [Lachnospiraceae bacterium]
FVVNASSEENQSVVNGMSNNGRDEINSNSAIVVNVTPEDFEAEGFGNYGVLAGVEYQRKYEALAYKEGNGHIPVQTLKDFKANVATEKLGDIKPNIKGKYTLGNLNNCLPPYVNNAIIEGISYYDGKLKGFAREDSVLSGIESRTSSPVRITRDDTFMSTHKGIFPCGEGAGYAGGITSAAVDGIKVAEACAAYLNELQ